MPLASRVRIAALVALLTGAAAADPLEEVPQEVLTEPFEVTADELEYHMDRELYVGRGNVVIRQTTRTLRADWAAFNTETGVGVASGDVELVDAGEVLEADFVAFEIDSVEGVVRGGSFESTATQFRARADEISKTGERSYTFRDGEFTTCRCPEEEGAEPWRIRAEEAEIEVEGYATARDARFEVLGVPVAWFPWLVFPVMTERSSGFLLPEVSLSSFSGFEVGLPYFWAPTPEVGVVVTPRYSVERGFGSAALFEYVRGEESSGELEGAYYHDEEIDADSIEEPFGRDRWSAAGTHDWALPGELDFLTDFRFASDNEVPYDFDELNEHRSDRFLESHATLSRGFGSLDALGLAVGAAFRDDLQSPEDLDRDRVLLQRWPTARADWLPSGLFGTSWLVPSLEVDYARFDAISRAESQLETALPGPRGIFLDTGIDGLPNGVGGFPRRSEPGTLPDPHQDDFATNGGPEGDGRFQEGEPLTDRGHRLQLQPRLAVPLDWRGVQLVPEVGWHQTFYDTRKRGERGRGFATARVDLSTRLTRRFGDVLHVLEPRAGYALAYTRSQERNTIFVPATAAPQDRLRALDLDSLTRDDADRIDRAQAATVGFDNRLYGSGGTLLADFRLLGLYDFEERVLDALVIDGRALPHPQVDARFHADFDPDRGRFDEGLASLSWAHPAGLKLSADYRWSRTVPLFFESFLTGDRFEEDTDVDHIHQTGLGIGLDLTAQWSVRYQIAYSIEGDLALANRGAVEYLSRCGCWAVGVEISQDRSRGVDAKLLYRLVGFGGDRPRRGGLLDGLGGLW